MSDRTEHRLAALEQHHTDTVVDINGLLHRIEQLEEHSHEPFDFSHLIERIDQLEGRIDLLEQRIEREANDAERATRDVDSVDWTHDRFADGARVDSC